MNDNINTDLIDDYLLDRLEGNARRNFEVKIKEDANLAVQVKQQEKLLKALELNGQLSLKKELKSIHREVIEQEAKIVKFNWRPLLAAAAVVLFGIMGWWLFQEQHPSSQDLFASNYEPFKMGLDLRNGQSNATAEINEITSLYTAKKYNAVIPLMENLIAAPDASAQLYLGLGIAKIEIDDAPGALKAFNKIIELNDPFLIDEARWYTALVHLKDGQNAKAKAMLNVLAENVGADHHLEAKKLLQDLN